MTVDRSGSDPVVLVGPPYRISALGAPQPPIGLQMLMAKLDGAHWPLQNCGDRSVGVGAAGNGWGLLDTTFSTYSEIDEGPALGGPFPADPPTYPGVGITAYGCEIDCQYIITGDLGAEVIVGKIDGQWHILRVTGSASTIPLTGSHNECRCCGSSRKNRKLRAEIISASVGCAQYAVGTQFVLDPISYSTSDNPLRISLSCLSRPESLLEDIVDWTAYACGNEAEMISLDCCAPVDESGGGSGSCRFEAVIRTQPAEGCSDCSYDILIWDEPGDPCIEFDDVEFGEPVVMEACGLSDLPAGTRVIMARFPATDTGRDALSGQEPIEWFVVRACTEQDCANQCDNPPPQGPPCCGVLCSEMPAGLTATVEILASDCCAGAASVTLDKQGAATQCDGAADTKWFAHDLTDPAPPEIIICSGAIAVPPFYPTKVAINNLELICGSAEDLCGDAGTSSASPTDGPVFSLWVSYYETYATGGSSGRVLATQNRVASCCSPLYLEYEITIPVCFIAGAGVITASTTLKITITE